MAFLYGIISKAMDAMLSLKSFPRLKTLPFNGSLEAFILLLFHCWNYLPASLLSRSKQTSSSRTSSAAHLPCPGNTCCTCWPHLSLLLLSSPNSNNNVAMQRMTTFIFYTIVSRTLSLMCLPILSCALEHELSIPIELR